jgi:hypothetical protein
MKRYQKKNWRWGESDHYQWRDTEVTPAVRHESELSAFGDQKMSCRIYFEDLLNNLWIVPRRSVGKGYLMPARKVRILSPLQRAVRTMM